MTHHPPFTARFPQILHSILSPRMANRLHFLFDLSLSITWLCIGRILPSLRSCLPTSPTHLANRTAIITGSNSGIGLQIATDLAEMGANVILACRSMDKAENAKAQILSKVPNAKDRVRVLKLDTSSLESVRTFAKCWQSRQAPAQTIDILVHNAGIAGASGSAPSAFSEDGFELTYATNFLGSFLLTHLLEEYLSEDARIVFTSSTGQYGGKTSKTFSINSVKQEVEQGFHTNGSELNASSSSSSNKYSMTKHMQCAFARSLQLHFDQQAARRGLVKRRVVHSFTPGFTFTPIFQKFEIKSLWTDPGFALLKATTQFATDVSEGAATGSWLASTDDPEVVSEGKGGRYWDRCVPRLGTADLLNKDILDRLWTRWEADAGVEWRQDDSVPSRKTRVVSEPKL